MITEFEIDSKLYPINLTKGSAILIGSLMFLSGIITVFNSITAIGILLILLGLINLIFAIALTSRNSIFRPKIEISKKGIRVKYNYFLKSDFYSWVEIQAFDITKDYLEIKSFTKSKRYYLVINPDELISIKKLIKFKWKNIS